MKGPNLSEWAIAHRVLIFFFMALALVVGVQAYINLGREEDPSFSVQTMIVAASWPGATVTDMTNQVTNRLEEKLEETPNLDFLRSYTKPGSTVIYVNLKDSTPASEIPDTWYEVRKKVSDIRQELPSGVQGPVFNDEFGDVFGIIYGLTYDGFTPREARDAAETARMAFLAGTDVGKVDIYGTQDERIYITFSPAKLAALGLSLDQVLQSISAQNAVTPSGVINTSNESILIEVSGALADVAGVAAINLFINGRFYNVAELGTITRGHVDPPTKMFRVNGRDAVGIAASMRAGGNNLAFGDSIHAIATRLQQQLPIGLDLVQVSDQPEIVREAIGTFTDALFEAIAIVLLVSFVSLGLRAGLVVALSIPLVLAIVFLYMDAAEISLQRVSLGALVISLGLLVDDAMITIESMVSQIEEGVQKVVAAGHAYVSTAFPMLTGTVVTILAFLPIGFARSNVGQYTYSLFAVIAVSLTVSWIVAVIFAPVIGVTVLPERIVKKRHGPGRFMRAFRAALIACMRYRWITIAVTLGLFGLSLFGQGVIQRQFFPASDRNEVLVTLNLPKNASIFATRAEVENVEKLIAGDGDVLRYSAYAGGGAPRFYLPLDVQLDNAFAGQLVVVGKDIEARDRIAAKLKSALADNDAFLARVSLLELGPPVGWPVQYRVSAPTTNEARAGSRAGGRSAPPIGTGDHDQLRLERGEQGGSHRGEPGPCAAGRSQLPGPCQRSSDHPQRRDRHRGQGQHLSDRRRRPRLGRGAPVAGRPAEPADQPAERPVGAAPRNRRPRLRPRRRLCLAPRPAADDHRPGRADRGPAGAHGLPADGPGHRRNRRQASGRSLHRERRDRREERPESRRRGGPGPDRPGTDADRSR